VNKRTSSSQSVSGARSEKVRLAKLATAPSLPNFLPLLSPFLLILSASIIVKRNKYPGITGNQGEVGVAKYCEFGCDNIYRRLDELLGMNRRRLGGYGWLGILCWGEGEIGDMDEKLETEC